jgi:hypothetical protein
VILGGLTELYKATGDTNYLNQAVAIADAAIASLNDGKGILAESCEPDNCGGADVPQFKGIFARYLAHLYDLTRKPGYYQFLRANARSIWANDRDDSNRFGLRWNGPIDTVDAARHSSAMMPISALAEPVTANLFFAKGSGGPAFNHEVGVASGTLAWKCDSANATRAGFMQTGPNLVSLSKGAHTVYFRMTVDATNQSKANLVRLDLRENKNGTVLATREVAWNQFRARSEAENFGLVFTNAIEGDSLEFRVYWNNTPEAPTLTLTDVTVDEAHAYPAANLGHDVGQLDGMNAWCADPARNHASGFITRGAIVSELSAGAHSVMFELKVDNFNWDQSTVATISAVDADSGEIQAARDLTRNDFSTALYHTMVLKFNAQTGHRYDFRTYWHYASQAPRLTQRSVIVK